MGNSYSDALENFEKESDIDLSQKHLNNTQQQNGLMRRKTNEEIKRLRQQLQNAGFIAAWQWKSENNEWIDYDQIVSVKIDELNINEEHECKSQYSHQITRTGIDTATHILIDTQNQKLIRECRRIEKNEYLKKLSQMEKELETEKRNNMQSCEQIEQQIIDISSLETEIKIKTNTKVKMDQRLMQMESEMKDLKNEIETLQHKNANSDDIKVEDDIKLCEYGQKATEVMVTLRKKLNIPFEFMDKNNDKCFCNICHKLRNEGTVFYRGEPQKKYVLPIGWYRFGLRVDEGKCKMNKVWNTWHVAYHGTKYMHIGTIFKSGLHLLKPGDSTIEGNKLSIQDGHIKSSFKRTNLYNKTQEMFDPNQIFASPSLKYSSCALYSDEFKCCNDKYKVKAVFQLRMRPGSYSIGHETIGANGAIIDDEFNNNELEWYTKENIGVVIHGLLLKVDDS